MWQVEEHDMRLGFWKRKEETVKVMMEFASYPQPLKSSSLMPHAPMFIATDDWLRGGI